MKDDTMFGRLMAKLRGTPAADVATEAVAALQADFDAFKASAALELATATANLETALTAVQEADARVVEMQAALDAVAAEQEKALAAAEAAKLQTRKEKIEATVGSEKADALMTATTGLDDTAFDAVLAAMTTASTNEAKSKMFTERGAAAEVDANKVVELSAEMKLLQDKYPAAK